MKFAVCKAHQVLAGQNVKKQPCVAVFSGADDRT